MGCYESATCLYLHTGAMVPAVVGGEGQGGFMCTLDERAPTKEWVGVEYTFFLFKYIFIDFKREEGE